MHFTIIAKILKILFELANNEPYICNIKSTVGKLFSVLFRVRLHWGTKVIDGGSVTICVEISRVGKFANCVELFSLAEFTNRAEMTNCVEIKVMANIPSGAKSTSVRLKISHDNLCVVVFHGLCFHDLIIMHNTRLTEIDDRLPMRIFTHWMSEILDKQSLQQNPTGIYGTITGLLWGEICSGEKVRVVGWYWVRFLVREIIVVYIYR